MTDVDGRNQEKAPTHVIDPFIEDVFELLKAYENRGTVSFDAFRDVWKSKHLTSLHACVAATEEYVGSGIYDDVVTVICAPLLHEPQPPLPYRVGVLYTLYTFFFTQPDDRRHPTVPVSLEAVEQLVALRKECIEQSYLEAYLCFKKLSEAHAFEIVTHAPYVSVLERAYVLHLLPTGGSAVSAHYPGMKERLDEFIPGRSVPSSMFVSLNDVSESVSKYQRAVDDAVAASADEFPATSKALADVLQTHGLHAATDMSTGDELEHFEDISHDIDNDDRRAASLAPQKWALPQLSRRLNGLFAEYNVFRNRVGKRRAEAAWQSVRRVTTSKEWFHRDLSSHSTTPASRSSSAQQPPQPSRSSTGLDKQTALRLIGGAANLPQMPGVPKPARLAVAISDLRSTTSLPRLDSAEFDANARTE